MKKGALRAFCFEMEVGLRELRTPTSWGAGMALTADARRSTLRHSMHIHSRDAAIKRCHECSPESIVYMGDGGHVGPEASRHRMTSAGHFTVRPQGTIRGTKGPDRIGLGVGVMPPNV